MKKLTLIGLTIVWLFFIEKVHSQESMSFKGQLSGYTHYNANNVFPWWNGGRYIPQVNVLIPVNEENLIDFEASANIYGNIGIKSFNNTSSNGNIKPYRVWTRFSTNQFEIRAGLQKINFGSASILRPLMWFDQVDPRDPLQLTDGVWGLLGRYYFLNNATIWFWTLYGNKNPKGWEIIKTNRSVPEIGGRVQHPVSTGEAAFSYHYRVADSRELAETAFRFEKIPEHRIGLDARFDWEVGLWVEASWKHMTENMGMFTNQEILNLGVDYTFGLGNGLTVIYEQLFAAFDEKAIEFKESTTFSLLSASYPLGIFDNLSFLLYFDWKNHSAYNFINWKKQFNNTTIFVMGYRNPKNYNIPTQRAAENLFAGTGIQIMLVFNH
jgi:hypothetical protein